MHMHRHRPAVPLLLLLLLLCMQCVLRSGSAHEPHPYIVLGPPLPSTLDASDTLSHYTALFPTPAPLERSCYIPEPVAGLPQSTARSPVPTMVVMAGERSPRNGDLSAHLARAFASEAASHTLSWTYLRAHLRIVVIPSVFDYDVDGHGQDEPSEQDDGHGQDEPSKQGASIDLARNWEISHKGGGTGGPAPYSDPRVRAVHELLVDLVADPGTDVVAMYILRGGRPRIVIPYDSSDLPLHASRRSSCNFELVDRLAAVACGACLRGSGSTVDEVLMPGSPGDTAYVRLGVPIVMTMYVGGAALGSHATDPLGPPPTGAHLDAVEAHWSAALVAAAWDIMHAHLGLSRPAAIAYFEAFPIKDPDGPANDLVPYGPSDHYIFGVTDLAGRAATAAETRGADAGAASASASASASGSGSAHTSFLALASVSLTAGVLFLASRELRAYRLAQVAAAVTAAGGSGPEQKEW